MARKLKVFRAQMGFHEAVVAAPSQKAALEAWGSRQDLFGEGLATVADDPKAEAAALAAPGVVLRRPAGSKGAFRKAEDGAADLPRLPKPAPAPKSALPAKPAPKPVDRSRLEAAEAAVKQAQARREAALADLARERRALDARELDLRRDQDAEQRRLQRALEAAGAAYDKALRASKQ